MGVACVMCDSSDEVCVWAWRDSSSEAWRVWAWHVSCDSSDEVCVCGRGSVTVAVRRGMCGRGLQEVRQFVTSVVSPVRMWS